MEQTETLKDVLQFYVDAGVDIALDEMPHDRLAVPPQESRAGGGAATAQPAAVRSSASAPTPGFSETKPHEVNVQEARDRAASANSLDELMALLMSYEGCGLKRTATHTVFEDGNRDAKIMLVGEAPGRDEDLQGKPFVGRSGQFLDRMLKAAGFDRSHVYIGNIVAWRPPGNRAPTTAEMELCKPFITRQIELMKPELLVFLGASSAKNMLQSSDGILKLRGKWRTYSKAEIPVLPMLHPAYLLRQPAQKRLAWRDLLSLRKAAIEKAILSPDA
uniref:uracil-DNA glycosylase n=1 Tax=Pararhizobium sp. IMCC3301 TaxID=3067904 RepID=UPI0027428E81|nr:uracil-DNA glycosylase [Pararhizobium sp. IMCC3301]